MSLALAGAGIARINDVLGREFVRQGNTQIRFGGLLHTRRDAYLRWPYWPNSLQAPIVRVLSVDA